jgi:hypothetical protein
MDKKEFFRNSSRGDAETQRKKMRNEQGAKSIVYEQQLCVFASLREIIKDKL